MYMLHVNLHRAHIITHHKVMPVYSSACSMSENCSTDLDVLVIPICWSSHYSYLPALCRDYSGLLPLSQTLQHDNSDKL